MPLSVTLKTSEGLIQVPSYYTETTVETGGTAVAGLREYDRIKKGSSGTPVVLRKYEYTAQDPVGSGGEQQFLLLQLE